jgi:hypothetical protein
MPLYNHTGDPMPLLPKEERLENEKYAGFYWNRDENYIMHMSPRDLKKWLHSLNPREALILASTYGISDRLKKQLSYKRWTIITDWLWRLWH